MCYRSLDLNGSGSKESADFQALTTALSSIMPNQLSMYHAKYMIVIQPLVHKKNLMTSWNKESSYL